MLNDGSVDTQRIYAWLGRTPEGVEGIVTVEGSDGKVPLMSTDEAVARTLKSHAVQAANLYENAVRLVVFERSRTLDT